MPSCLPCSFRETSLFFPLWLAVPFLGYPPEFAEVSERYGPAGAALLPLRERSEKDDRDGAAAGDACFSVV